MGIISLAQDSSKAVLLWREMDKDGDGQVVKEEFCELMPKAFRKVIRDPLVQALAEKGKLKLAPPEEIEKRSFSLFNMEIPTNLDFSKLVMDDGFAQDMPIIPEDHRVCIRSAWCDDVIFAK